MCSQCRPVRKAVVIQLFFPFSDVLNELEEGQVRKAKCHMEFLFAFSTSRPCAIKKPKWHKFNLLTDPLEVMTSSDETKIFGPAENLDDGPAGN